MKKERQTDPFSWDNISINKYYKIYDILFDETPGEEEINKQVRLVSVITGKPEEEIWNMPLTESTALISKLIFLNKFDIKSRSFSTITVNDEEYDVQADASKMTTSQFVDYQMFTKLPFRDAIDKLLSIFVIPKGHLYNDGYDIVALQRDFRENMPFKLAQEILGFILSKYRTSLESSLTYLENQIKKMKNRGQDTTEMQEKIQEVKNLLNKLLSFHGSASSKE